jgi:hypothetical protein
MLTSINTAPAPQGITPGTPTQSRVSTSVDEYKSASITLTKKLAIAVLMAALLLISFRYGAYVRIDRPAPGLLC